ncbi:MAG: membrane dipeptidase [Solirubrobacterales bacterium]
MIADAHNDFLLAVAARRRDDNPFAATTLGPLRAGEVGMQVCPISVDLDQEPRAPLFALLEQVTSFARAVRENEDAVVAVARRSDLDAVEAGSRIGLMLSMEDCSAFGRDLDWVEMFWELGVRMVSLTWNRRNLYADGGAEKVDGGLSELGRRLVDRLVAAGMIIDLAHASRRTFFDVLGQAPAATVVVSHACCRAVYDVPRNLDDDQLRALAERGGVLGLMVLPLAVDPRTPTLARFVDHLDHAVATIGIDNVGLGADFMRQIVEAGVEDPTPGDAYLGPGARIDDDIDGVSGPEHFGLLVDALRARGYEGDRLAAITHGNLVRVLRAGLPA